MKPIGIKNWTVDSNRTPFRWESGVRMELAPESSFWARTNVLFHSGVLVSTFQPPVLLSQNVRWAAGLVKVAVIAYR